MIAHSPYEIAKMTISRYINTSSEPISAIRLVITLVVNLSLMCDPSTNRLRITEEMMNGKGTGEPGFGMQAVLSALMM